MKQAAGEGPDRQASPSPVRHCEDQRQRRHRPDRHATFNPGQTTKTITIEVKGDRKREGNELFYLDLFGLSGNALFTKSRGIGTILNDD